MYTAQLQCENDFQLPFWSKADHKWASALLARLKRLHIVYIAIIGII